MREDYQQFKEDAVRELRAHWLTNRTTVKEAIIDLYQPNAADYAASKTFLSHVDSVAHLRLAAMEQTSSEDLVKLSALCSPVVDLNAPNANKLLAGADHNQSLGLHVMSGTSSETSEDSCSSGGVEPYSPSSTDTDAAQMGDTAVAATPLCLGTPDSASTLLGQVTAPHIDPITPMKTDGGSPHVEAGVATPPPPPQPIAVLHTKPVVNIHSSLSSISRIVDTGSTPASVLADAACEDRERERARDREREWARERENDKEKERERERDRERESKPPGGGGEGLRIILVEDSPASSISSFETPIMIYGQS